MKLNFSPEVLSALSSNSPIVALESTIITHGLAYPQNLQTALSVESVIRSQNATPATIAIILGEIHIGLTEDQIDYLAKQGGSVRKCSRRDLAACIAKKQNGSTTVAATMILAKMAGLKVFVTGGIGGVHRGVDETMDVSADLRELGMTDIMVVCAGAKSILDIKRTLEYLETEGVPVIGYKTMDFPAFFTSKSGSKCSDSVDSALQAAQLIKTQNILKLQNGILLAVPIPSEEEANGQQIQQAIDQALAESLYIYINNLWEIFREKGIEGAECTPFLLKRVNELTNGDSSKSNVALIKNNAKIGAQIAVELYKLL